MKRGSRARLPTSTRASTRTSTPTAAPTRSRGCRGPSTYGDRRPTAPGSGRQAGQARSGNGGQRGEARRELDELAGRVCGIARIYAEGGRSRREGRGHKFGLDSCDEECVKCEGECGRVIAEIGAQECVGDRWDAYGGEGRQIPGVDCWYGDRRKGGRCSGRGGSGRRSRAIVIAR